MIARWHVVLAEPPTGTDWVPTPNLAARAFEGSGDTPEEALRAAQAQAYAWWVLVRSAIDLEMPGQSSA